MVGDQKNLRPIVIILAALIIAGAIVWVTMIYVKGIEKPKGVLERVGPAVLIQPEISREEALAKCLTEKGVKFYGTYWCGYCIKQKELFGEAAKYLPYIECAPDRATKEELAKCEEASIRSIPDWRFPDGRQELGMLPLEKLAELSGCQL